MGRWGSSLRPEEGGTQGNLEHLAELGLDPLTPDAQLGPSPHSEVGGTSWSECKGWGLRDPTKGRAFLAARVSAGDAASP